jgi:hypothetical protein
MRGGSNEETRRWAWRERRPNGRDYQHVEPTPETSHCLIKCRSGTRLRQILNLCHSRSIKRLGTRSHFCTGSSSSELGKERESAKDETEGESVGFCSLYLVDQCWQRVAMVIAPADPESAQEAFRHQRIMKSIDSARNLQNASASPLVIHSPSPDEPLSSSLPTPDSSEPDTKKNRLRWRNNLNKRSKARMYSQMTMPTALQKESDEIDAMVSTFVADDTSSSKTWSRRFVEAYLLQFSWYAPKKLNMANPPSLKKVGPLSTFSRIVIG